MFLSAVMRQRLLRIVGYGYLAYLGLLPALATFTLLAVYGPPSWFFLLFLGGIIAVSVYLAYIASYTVIPGSLLRALLLLLDGPFFVLVSLGQGINLFSFAVEGYLIDGTAVWIGIFLLALHSPLPTRGQRIFSLLFMLVALVVTSLIAWPYVRDVLWGQWLRIGWLLLGLIETVYVSYRTLREDNVLRDIDFSMSYILIFLFAWLICLFIGGIEPVGEWVRGLLVVG